MDLTVVLTNWKRPANVAAIVEKIVRLGCHDAPIWLWDNSDTPGQLHHNIAEFVRPSWNAKCAGRWWLAAQAQTEFVLIMDDDLVPSDERVFADTVAALKQYDGRPVGAVGVRLLPGKRYHECHHVGIGKQGKFAQPIRQDTSVDIVKGRYFAVATERLAKLPMKLPDFEDDIAASACLGPGTILAALQDRFTSLPTGKEAVSCRPGHMQQREFARRAWFEGREFVIEAEARARESSPVAG